MQFIIKKLPQLKTARFVRYTAAKFTAEEDGGFEGTPVRTDVG